MVRMVSTDEAQSLARDHEEYRQRCSLAATRTDLESAAIDLAHTVIEQAATIRRQSLDYLSLDGQAIELQDRLREVEAERDAEKARADAAEAKVRAVEALHTHGLIDSGRGMVDVCDVCTYDETEDVPSTVGWANWPCPTGQALANPEAQS